MQSTRLVETMVGVFVALGIAALFMLAMKVSNLSTFADKGGYVLTAQFDNVGGLKPLSPVSIGGVRIGRVTAIRFNQDTYEAEVTMVINPNYNRLPVDSSASIFTAGLLGEQYISLEPGGAERYLKDGDQLDRNLSQSALVLEKMIGQFLFSKAAGDSAQ